MLRDTLRLSAALLLLAAAIGAAAVLNGTANPLPVAAPPSASATTAVAETPYIVDVQGWYQITPQERAVTSRYDLRLASLPGSLPMQLGEWRGSPLPPSPGVDFWFDHPDVATERQYIDPQGNIMWLAVFGSAGLKSYHLFEHTPQTCYPGTGWNILRQDVDRIPLGDSAIYAQRGLAEKDGQRLLVLYWYIWDNFERDSERGVLSFRLTAPIQSDEATTLALMKEQFIPLIFDRVLTWRRF